MEAPTTVYGPKTFNSTDAGWGGYTFIQLLTAEDMLAASGTKMRITTNLSVWTSGGTMKGYVGQGKASNDVYDFIGTPAQILWNGLDTFTSNGSNLEQISDAVTLPEAYDETKPYLFAFYFSAATAVTISDSDVSSIAGQTLYKSGDDAATVNKTGYATNQTGFPELVSKVEVGFFLT